LKRGSVVSRPTIEKGKKEKKTKKLKKSRGEGGGARTFWKAGFIKKRTKERPLNAAVGGRVKKKPCEYGWVKGRASEKVGRGGGGSALETEKETSPKGGGQTRKGKVSRFEEVHVKKTSET